MTNITLQPPVNAIITPEIPAVTQNISTVNIQRMVDLPSSKQVHVFTSISYKPIILWERDAYDAIGQWTDTDVENRLIEILNSGSNIPFVD